MRVAKYVGDLLFDYECVVIPGLGGFITDDKSVLINEFTHKFKPPFRKVHFNAHLRANDGLLINHVAQEEQINYKIAKSRVDNFVFQCKNALDNGKRINFKNIGYLFQNADKNIVFHQDISTNYNPNSFGLTSLVSPVIERESDEQKVKKVIKTALDSTSKKSKHTDRKPSQDVNKRHQQSHNIQASRRLSSFSKQLVFLAIIFGLMGSGYIYMRRDAMGYYLNRYASHIPFFYSSVNDYLANNINSTPVATLSRNTASLFPTVTNNTTTVDIKKTPVTKSEWEIINNTNNTPVEESIKTEEIVSEPVVELSNDAKPETSVSKAIPAKVNVENSTSEPKKAVVKPTISSIQYYIIAGSFANENNAKNLVSELKSKGYKALIADTNKYGMFRVAFLETNSKQNADSRLTEIKNNYNPKAWILSKKN